MKKTTKSKTKRNVSTIIECERIIIDVCVNVNANVCVCDS